MIGFFTFDDLEPATQEEVRQLLIDDNTLLEIIKDTLETVKSKLRHKYDVPTIFAQRGEERNRELIMLIRKIVLYQAYCRNTFRVIPQHVVDENRYALDSLRVAGLPADDKEATINMELPLLPNGGKNNAFRAGSNTWYKSSF
jgi:hypothetical protein